MKDLMPVAFALWLTIPAAALAEEPAAAPVPTPPASDAAPVKPAGQPTEAEELKALEAQMQEAVEKVDALKTPAAGNTEVEEISAQPAAEASGTASVAVTAAEDKKDEKPFGLVAVMEHGFGTGTFIADPYVREANDSVAMSWDIRPSYTFDFFGHKLKLWPRILLDILYTDPTDQTARHVTPYDLSVYLSDAEIYKEAFTDVTINGGLRYFFPTSFESINVKKQWGAAKLYAGLARSFGALDVAYTLGATKYFNSSKIKSAYSFAPRQGDGVQLSGLTDPAQIDKGPANNNWLVDQTFELVYNVNEQLAISYVLMILNYYKYAIPVDQYSVSFAKEVGRVDQLWPTFEISYNFTDLLKKAVDIPFEVSAALGATSLHPAFSDDNRTFYVPLVFNTWGNNLAANNYGTLYLDLVGTY